MKKFLPVLIMIAAIMFSGFSWKDLFKTKQNNQPLETTAPVVITEETEPALTEEEFNDLMKQCMEDSRYLYRNKLADKVICYWEDEDRYSFDFIPEEYLPKTPEDVGCVLSVQVTPVDSRKTGNISQKQVKLKMILKQNNNWDCGENEFIASAPNYAHGTARGYKNQEVVAQWVKSVWEDYAKAIPYNAEMAKVSNTLPENRESTPGYIGGKLAAYHASMGMFYLSDYIPEDLVAHKAEEYLGTLTVHDYTWEYRGKTTYRLTLELKIREHHKYAETVLESVDEPVDPAAVRQWVQENWESYQRKYG